MVAHPSRHDPPPLANRLAKHASHVNPGPSRVSNASSTAVSATSPLLTRRSTYSLSAPSLREKLRCLREREPVMCPPSPPIPEITLLNEEEYYRRSRERVDAMTQRLANLPLYQARCMINLSCTQLRGPFEPGSRYWGMGAPISLAPTDIALNNAGPVPEMSRAEPRREAPPLPDISNAPLLPFPFPPPAPGFPATPQGVRAVNIELLPSKTSVGRPIMPPDADILNSTRSPTPTPLVPRPGSQVPRSSQAPRASQVPTALFHSGDPTNPPETPKAPLNQTSSVPPARPHESALRQPRLSSTSAQIFPRHSTPARPPGYVGEDSPSRETSPLFRFSQREPTQIPKPSPSRPPRFSPSKILSQHIGSSGDEFESQLNVDRQLQDITDFMEEDITS
ncbi:hypothetical protein RhiJN_29003 [Ceratobasidium sp. AG-Ba]|nr:hypothetical protein RhiJN_29003 [Ceratobasidium sp. AG-Ba]